MEYQRRFIEALNAGEGGPVDVILCPACALPAFTHGSSRDLLTAGGIALCITYSAILLVSFP
jgi:Asp-tRNA(Asn)/Glu-tRNA(Gln) amidotransferase A subunit family amidase